MKKYLVGIGALVVVGVAYLLLAPAANPPAPAPAPDATIPAAERAPPAPAPFAAPSVVPEDAAPAARDDETVLRDMAADVREALPVTVTDTLTMTDARFLPRMWIMEYTYVTTDPDPRAMTAVMDARAKRVCLEAREMFEMGATLRNSFEDRSGALVHRDYLLPEECQQFY